MEPIHVPEEVLNQAEEAEMRSRAEYMNSGEYIERFIRRINAIRGGKQHGEN
tara:strand:- start:937 stop:1092 length:156 start_codon:yes stop_codon:yes gene_type:complete